MSTEIVSVSDDANCDDAPQEKQGCLLLIGRHGYPKEGSFKSDHCQSSCLTQKMWVKKKTLTLTITKTIVFRRKSAEAAKNAFYIIALLSSSF
jgi:hypothetical protein